MGKYRVFLKRSAEKELTGVPSKDLEKLIARIQGLADDPRPANSQKLSAQERYRLRQGDYRIVYSIDVEERAVTIVKIGHRREIYRAK